MAEQPDLDDAGQHFDSSEQLSMTVIARYMRLRRKQDGLTVKGSLISVLLKGASMIKLPLSLTMGPAFITAIRSLGSVEPSVRKLCSTLA